MKQPHIEEVPPEYPATEGQVLEAIIRRARAMRRDYPPPYPTRYIMVALMSAYDWLTDAHDIVQTGQRLRAEERQGRRAKAQQRIEAAARRQPPFDKTQGCLRAAAPGTARKP